LEYTLVEDTNNLGLFIDELSHTNLLLMDTEATSLDPFTSTFLLLQIKANNTTFIFDVRKLGERTVTYIVSLVKDSNKLCLFHNAKFDQKLIKVNTGEMISNVYDTMLAEILIHQGLGRNYPSYAELANKYCGVEVSKEERLSFVNFTGEITSEMYEYSAIDVEYLEPIMREQVKLIGESKQERVLALENNLSAVTADMELNGVLVDVPYWRELEQIAIKKGDEFKRQVLDTIFSQIEYSKYQNPLELADVLHIPVKAKRDRTALSSLGMETVINWLRENFNVASPKQMLTVLNLLGVPTPSTNEKILAKYRNQHPIIDMLLGFREHQKKISNYGSKFL
jgi:DNA polymerase I-like protein with 3'-5' exonuclease and polymerase domains